MIASHIMGLEHCRVVLVQTLYPGNLGATARVMRNFGLEDLVLVAPVADPSDRRARRLSTHGEDILDRARIVHDLGEAVGDCVVVAGTSARSGGLFRKQTVGPPDVVLPHLVREMKAERPVALVFGTEPGGLPDDLVTRCHYLIRIPAGTAYPALNLAQAVAICLYELHRAWLALEAPVKEEVLPHEQPATFAEQEHMFNQLRDALERIHFLFGQRADALMHALRHLLGKARLSEMEVNLLLGLARQIRWYADECHQQQLGGSQ
jgi:tRNA/rRNA methyltransferase